MTCSISLNDIASMRNNTSSSVDFSEKKIGKWCSWISRFVYIKYMTVPGAKCDIATGYKNRNWVRLSIKYIRNRFKMLCICGPFEAFQASNKRKRCHDDGK